MVQGGDRCQETSGIRLRRHRTQIPGRCAPGGRRVRDYSPTTGTFLTPDPLDGVDGTPTVANPYHYTDNDPLNKTDPLGLRPEEPDFDPDLPDPVPRRRAQLASRFSISLSSSRRAAGRWSPNCS
jgi:hypothetical protein